IVMNANGKKLLVSRAVNKLGDIMYDYGNSVWIASMGTVGQTFLGIYKMAELIVQIFVGPFAGALADRFDRRKILLLTDLLSATMCLVVALLGEKTAMVYGLIVVNVVLAFTGVFSQSTYKAFIRDIVNKEEVVAYNSNLTTVVQVIKVSSPILGFVILQHLGLQLTLLLDSLTFFVSFFLVGRIRIETRSLSKSSTKPSVILKDIWEGMCYIYEHKDIFFLLIMASAVNFFIVMYDYLLPFMDDMLVSKGAYATFLSVAAVSVLIGSALSRFVKNNLTTMLWVLMLSNTGIILVALPALFGLPVWLSYGGQVIVKIFEAIFNIHFFSQVQIRTDKAYMGRVFSSIYTLALCLTPLGTLIVTLLPNAVQLSTFIWIGLASVLVAVVGLFYAKYLLS
ncbi:MAG: MFS transporter, partial [Streptococcus orisratti]|nr:MFS transporter [Streptococcus orisratti]